MFSKSVLVIANFSLGIISLFLLLNLFNFSTPSVGAAIGFLDKEEPFCFVQSQGGFTSWDDLDRCCLEASNQLSCEFDEKNIDGTRVDWTCRNTPTGISYNLNNKAYQYCRTLDVWRK